MDYLWIASQVKNGSSYNLCWGSLSYDETVFSSYIALLGIKGWPWNLDQEIPQASMKWDSNRLVIPGDLNEPTGRQLETENIQNIQERL